MEDYFLFWKKCVYRFSGLQRMECRFKGESRTKKRNILVAIILVLCMRLFFYPVFAEMMTDNENEILVDINRISKINIDPMNKIKNYSEGREKNKNFTLVSKNDKKEKNVDSQLENPGNEENQNENELNFEKASQLVSGHPIEKMLPYIAKREKKTAQFLIAIAKKESNWGLHAPRLNGQDCYNYWGYKGGGKTALGYSCFDSPEQAISVVGDRIQSLIDKDINTPSKFLVWKCGSSCSSHNPQDVRKWVSDVEMYIKKTES